MARSRNVPITGAVLHWAVKESGYPASEIAAAAGVGVTELTSWFRGTAQPTVGQARALANKLKRPLATFLLPTPPKVSLPSVEFRRAGESGRRQLNPAERLRLREAGRLQGLLAWISEELNASPPRLPRFATTSDPAKVARVARNALGLAIDTQVDLSSASAAWHAWRSAVERVGVYVIVFSIGLESCRGFSIWNERAPLIAINSSWSAEARIFTLLHELAHLLTRTNSACLEVGARSASPSDAVERWCERFAALVLIPDEALQSYVERQLGGEPVPDLDTVSRVAREFKTSRRAAALRLIEAEYAGWDLYRSIPPILERPRPGGGGAGRTRAQLRSDRYGSRALGDINNAIRRDVITTGDALDYLEAPALPSGAHGSPDSY